MFWGLRRKVKQLLSLGPCTASGQPDFLGMEDPIVLETWMAIHQAWRGNTKAQGAAPTFSLLEDISGAHDTCIQEGSYCPLTTHDFPTPTSQWLTILGWQFHGVPHTGLHSLPPDS